MAFSGLFGRNTILANRRARRKARSLARRAKPQRTAMPPIPRFRGLEQLEPRTLLSATLASFEIDGEVLDDGGVEIMVDPLVTTVHDETSGLQNAIATPSPPGDPGDADDNGIEVSSLPGEFSSRLVGLGLDQGEPGLTDDAIGAALSGYTGAADDEGQYAFNVTQNDGFEIDNLKFTDSSGTVYEGTAWTYDSSPVTVSVGGNELFLFTDDDNVLLIRKGSTTDDGETWNADSSGDIVAAVYIEESADLTTGKIWSVQFEALAHPDPDDDDESVDLTTTLFVSASRDLEFDLTDAPSGQNLFIMFGDGSITNDPSEVGIVATGQFPANQSAGENITSGQTINTSQAGVGDATFGIDNQLINEGEGIYFTFVTGPEPDFTVPNLDQNEADVETNIQFDDFLGAKGAEFQVVQFQSGGRRATAVVTITAYNETETALGASGANFVDELNNDILVSITSVEVFESDGVTPAAGVTINDNADGTFTIEGVQAGDFIQYFTDGDHNRVLIVNDGDGKGPDSADFDIGGFKLIQAQVVTASADINVQFEDDSPAPREPSPPGMLVLDETRPIGAETDGNGTPAGLDTVTADFADNFGTPEFGTDGPLGGTDATGTAYALLLDFEGIGSGLYAVDPDDTADDDGDGIGQGDEILLYVNDGGTLVTGSTAATEADIAVDGSDTYFTITVNTSDGDMEGEVAFTQTQNVWHGNTTSDDDTSTLLTTANEGSGLQIEQTLTDANGDAASVRIALGSSTFPVFKIEDDGPDSVVVDATADMLTLDESPPGGDGIASTTANFADNFAAITDYGTDGAGSTVYSLSLNGSDVGSGLYALDATDTADVGDDGDGTGQGGEILLNQSGDTVTGSAGGTDYFTISIDPGTGVVTFAQSNNIWHGDDTSDDDSETLTADEATDLQVVQAVTDADGDSDSDSINVGAGVFKIEDDGPDQVVFNDLDGEVTTVVQTVDPGWSGSPGTDGLGTLIVTAADSDSDPSNGITFDMLTADDIASTGTVDSFAFDEMDGRYEGTLTADFDNDASNGEETIGFTLSVNSDGTYDFQLDQVIVPVVTLSTDEGQLPAGGPDPVQTLTFDTTEVVFFAVDAATAVDGTSPIVPAIVIGEPDNPGLEATTEASLEAGAAPPIGDNTFSFIREEIKMNVSTTGIGVGNNVFQGYDPNGGTDGSIDPFNPDDLPTFDESFVINPEPLASSVKVFISKTAGGFLPPNDDGTLQGTAAKTDYLYYNAYDEMGIATEPILVTSDIVFDEADEAAGGTGENLWSFTVSIDDVNLEGLGDAIDAIQFTMGFGDIKIPKIEIVVRGDVPPNDIFLDFSAKLTDADGDMGAPGTFEINLLAPAEPEGASASSSTLASESEVDLIAEAYPILNLDGADEEEAADEKKDKDNTSAKRIRGVLNDGVDLLAV